MKSHNASTDEKYYCLCFVETDTKHAERVGDSHQVRKNDVAMVGNVRCSILVIKHGVELHGAGMTWGLLPSHMETYTQLHLGDRKHL